MQTIRGILGNCLYPQPCYSLPFTQLYKPTACHLLGNRWTENANDLRRSFYTIVVYGFYFSIQDTISSDIGVVREPATPAQFPFSSIINFWKFHCTEASSLPFSLF